MKSYWIESSNTKKFPKLNKDLEAEVCIIGGGITGLTIAYYLSKANVKTVLLEKDKICMQITGKSLVIEKFEIPEEKLNNIGKGEGGIVEIDGKKVGVYKTEDGKIFKINPVCSHLGCELSWNNLEKTWDCPCHGSRFTYDGKSIYAPSIKNIKCNRE